MLYQIKIIGELDQSWNDWLGFLESASERQENGSIVTRLLVDVPDQPALFGILDRIRDLNLVLVSAASLEASDKS